MRQSQAGAGPGQRWTGEVQISIIFLTVRLPAYKVELGMKFGETEIQATARDAATGRTVSHTVDFFTDTNPTYCTKL